MKENRLLVKSLSYETIEIHKTRKELRKRSFDLFQEVQKEVNYVQVQKI